MTLNQLKNILKKLKLPVAYSYFKRRVSPPYIVFSVAQTKNYFADNIVVKKMQSVNIELYTEEKNVELEENLEKILNDNELPYEIEGEIFIEEENIYQIIYKITV